MKISIAMTTYNGEKYILEQLESFANQTTLPDELVITDDGSTDKTLEIVEKYKKSVPFDIRLYINDVNLGYTQNFNKAMQLCSNELIFLSDQDDVWFPTKLEYMLNLTQQYPDKNLFMIDTELTDEKLKKSGLTKQGQIKDLGMSASSFVMGCCVAAKKSYLDLVLPVPQGFSGHDDWIVKISEILDLKYIDSSIQQYYRIHGKNTSTFSVNRLIKTEIPKITLGRRISDWWHFSKLSEFSDYVSQKSLLLARLEQLSKKEPYIKLVGNEINKLHIDIKSHEKRIDVLSSKHILLRIFNAINLYIHGGYKTSNGYKSLISDILHD